MGDAYELDRSFEKHGHVVDVKYGAIVVAVDPDGIPQDAGSDVGATYGVEGKRRRNEMWSTEFTSSKEEI